MHQLGEFAHSNRVKVDRLDASKYEVDKRRFANDFAMTRMRNALTAL